MASITEICDYLGNESHCEMPQQVSQPTTRRPEQMNPDLIIDYDDIDMSDSKVVGKGAVGLVIRARWQNKDVAVKMLRDFLADRSVKGTRAAIAKKDFNQEMYIVSQELRHPNLVQALGICSSESLSCMIVFEYIHGGSLDDVLFKKKRFGKPYRPSKKRSLSWCKQLASALDYLHSSKPSIIHRDVKPNNILITHDMKTLKLTDLGLATARSDDENRKMTGMTGSHCFMAPEVYRDTGFYSEKVDIYSAAMVMWCIGTGRHPSEGKDASIYTALSSFGMTPSLGDVKPSGLGAILTDAWALEAAQRPSAAELVARLDGLLAKTGKISSIFRKISSKIFTKASPAAPASCADVERVGSALSSVKSECSEDQTDDDTASRAFASADCTEKTGLETNWLPEGIPESDVEE
eukprot:CAMPEP_0177693190 /NCGR_PEP_ID=MMETSP0484_2-20121128/2265_1 /TAXON_ID=354590 /ORGANISM="Rhodomonas lens, Strain RHODO" /LENGTH=407 /DNA_ID=CAMNT_0019203979 /DNA_START=28 /DNA_END=1248 /DNA_ORIENTATION=+